MQELIVRDTDRDVSIDNAVRMIRMHWERGKLVSSQGLMILAPPEVTRKTDKDVK